MKTSHSPVPPTRLRMLSILVMQCAVVLACVAVTTVVALAVQERSIRAATEERVLDVSQSLAALPQVRTAVQGDAAEATGELQPLADILEEAAGVDYVVITDAAGIRLTHPTPAERGRMVSTDPSEILEGGVFVGTETGTIGPTLRAKVPVFAGEEVVGTASVGILESRLASDLGSAIAGLLPWVLGSVVVGCVVSALLTAMVRRSIRRLEAEAREAEAQRAIAHALRDQTHEFRTRLHVIRGLVAEGESEAALEYVDRLAPTTTGADAAAGAVGDPALRALLHSFGADFAGRFEVDPLTTVPRDALEDADLLVIANLVRNAVESADDVVRVLVVADDTDLHIDVADDGPGVAPELLDRIFDRGVSTKAGGGFAGAGGRTDERGVGLDIVRREVARRGGTITVGASDTGGARFTVEMPLAIRTAGR